MTPSLNAAYPMVMMMGFASILFMTASTGILQVFADPTMRGRVIALQSVVFIGSTPIGGPIVGWMSQHFGARIGLRIGALSCAVAAALGLESVRRRARSSLGQQSLP